MVDIWYETKNGNLFAHVKNQGSNVFRVAKEIKHRVPVGAIITVPENLQPTVTSYLTKHCGFAILGKEYTDDGKLCDVIQKVR